MNLFKKFLISVLFLSVPVFAQAQTTALTIIELVGTLLGRLVPIAIAAALLFFIWGLAIFIKNSGNEDGLKEGKQKMMWGLIALFVIIAVWGIVWFIANTFRIDPRMKAPVPDIPRATSGTGNTPVRDYQTTAPSSDPVISGPDRNTTN